MAGKKEDCGCGCVGQKQEGTRSHKEKKQAQKVQVT